MLGPSCALRKHQILFALATMLCLNMGVQVAADSAQGSASASELSGVPESVSFGKAVLSLSAYIWRDFMPIAVAQESDLAAAKGGRPMVARIQLMSQNDMPMPSRLRAEVVWIVQGDLVWETKPFEERSGDSGSYEFVIRGGPKWQPGSYVDVVVRLVDERGATLKLALRHQNIQAVS
jgi:hypothetical protein